MRLLLSTLALLVAHVAVSTAALPYYGNPAPNAGVVAKMPIHRRGGPVYNPDSDADLARFTSVLQSCLDRYSRTKRELQGNRVVRRALPLTDKLAPIGEDGSWYADVELGNPGQNIQFDIDMTSSDFWIESTTSVYGTRFEAGNSQSYFSDNKFVFRDCIDSLDSLVLGDKRFNVHFAHCSPPRASIRTLNPSGGIMGLAHSSLSQTSLPHFFEDAKEKGKLAGGVFAIEFNKDDPSASAVISFGGLAQNHDEPLYAPVKTFGFWQILFKSLMIDGNTVLDNIQGVIDVTSPFVLAPPEDVRIFYNAISGAQPLANGFWSYPCFENPKIHIEHGGWFFPLKDASLGKVKDSGYCVGPVVEADIAGLWVIGEPFLKGVLAIFDFDQKRVGIRVV
ncbi:aspartic peptidase domain-containing protein [Lipomyces kononenkoae]